MRRIRCLLFAVCALALTAACAGKAEESIPLEPAVGDPGDAADVDDADTVFVYICGAVVGEGVYELPLGSRVCDVIEMAGGLAPDAAGTELNQAQLLEDGMKIYVPTVGEATQSPSESDGRVNINKASKEELMTLPGVGESKADSIISYREKNGGFKSPEDIMNISGIKEGLYEKIKDLITL